jgi:hypothetical protein
VVVRSIVLAVVLVIPTIAWAAYGPARGFVVAACILTLAYLRSSIKILSPGTPAFADLVEAARAQGCRIALFRSFEEGPSKLTRSVLIPVLSGYGRLDVVFDQTLADAQDRGFLGEEAKLERLATLHRFENAEWRDRVAELIEQTDIAVIEATRLTPGVAWELANCFKYLPPWRVYPVINLEVLDEPLKEYLASLYERAGPEMGMPRDIRPRFFFLGEGANQGEAIALDVHAKMVGIVAIESGVQDPSAFGPGAARSLRNRPDDVPTEIERTNA